MQNNKPSLRIISGGQRELEDLHDKVMSLLDTREKKGIRDLLLRNSNSCKKLLFPYIRHGTNQAVVMTALTGILEAHARECYTIGYLDCLANRNTINSDQGLDP